ncbi:NAD-dependent epimerase/dehydratase family protein [Aquibacillus saliphilus]|uniref:NAD-dependent epimerase/dehydratase family protein n=1 Tax=Aquibacillus saliphilus TaxID=1909422 RepID=UPI001CEFCAFD|nr:NAD-dependent epimerase/dehydratase family protein [Aquibacillus saliphilus]
MKVLVTGGIGFIGTHVVTELIKNNYDVAIIDNRCNDEHYNHYVNVACYSVDINDYVDRIFEIERPDYVIHLAAQVDVNQSIADPGQDARSNILGTINILESCKKYDVKKLIFSSSAAIYGEPVYLPIDENHPQDPLSFYGISKRTAENYIATYCGINKINYTILRYSNVYGPAPIENNGEGNVISIFLQQMLDGESPTIFGNGDQTRDFIYVKDIAAANLAAIEHGNNQIFNISTNTQTSLNELVTLLNKLLAKVIKPVYLENRNADVKHSYLMNEKATEQLKFKPIYSLEQGLTYIVQNKNLN